MRLQAVAVLFALALAACGGGGGGSPSASGPINPAPALRTDLLFAYYYGRADFVIEQADHVNLWWASPEGGAAGQIAGLTQARTQGITNAALMVPAYLPGCVPQPEPVLRDWLQQLHTVGALDQVIAIYPIDEPDIRQQGPCSDATVTAQNAALRRVMAGFPELARAGLWVIYACDSGARPGQASYDAIGCDKYPDGCAALARYLEPMRAALRPGQRLLVVPGGADPWRQDPACFESYAHAHAEVVAIVVFLFQTEGETIGVRVNGMLGLYRAAGRKIKQ